MRAVLLLAVVGVVALVIAGLTGSTPLAVVVVALAAAGIVQLVRDWRSEPGGHSVADTAPATPVEESGAHHLAPDEFTPDISTDPDGPSSDARADQS